MKERLTFFQRYERIHGKLFGKKPTRKRFNFEIHIADGCNLGCKGCFHFSPLASQDAFYPLDEFEADFKRVSELFHGRFGWVHLLGGEPLLNPDIVKYLDIAGRYVKKGVVELITNGLLLPSMNEEFFASLMRNHIRVAITRYPVEFDYDKALELVLSHGCEGHFFGDRGKEGFALPYLNPESKASYQENYMHCIIANACVTLDHGKLTYCSLPAYVHFYNEKFGKTFDDAKDFISIDDHDKKEILDFLSTPHEFCRYCHPSYRAAHPIPWQKSAKEKEEWLC